jgi:hypothetical protein
MENKEENTAAVFSEIIDDKGSDKMKELFHSLSFDQQATLDDFCAELVKDGINLISIQHAILMKSLAKIVENPGQLHPDVQDIMKKITDVYLSGEPEGNDG